MDELNTGMDAWIEERLSLTPLEREADSLTSFAVEFGGSIPPEQIAARYSALEAYWEAEEDFKDTLELICNTIGSGLRGTGATTEALRRLPELLEGAADDLREAIEAATGIAGA
jgi:hypothetical protein